MERLTDFLSNKLSNIFPIVGGASGAVVQNEQLHLFPQWEMIISTCIIAALGAIIGYLVKIVFDLLFKNFKKDHQI